MNARQLFSAIMHYEDFDRMPVLHWEGWPELYAEWRQQGLPEDQSEHEVLDASPVGFFVSVDLALFPPFEKEIFEETEEYRILRTAKGVVCQEWKHKSGVPHPIDFTLKGAEGWDQYRKRLQPNPRRLPPNLDQLVENAKNASAPVVVRTGSMIGWLRNWMGVENLGYLAYDNRELLAEMVATIADLVIWGLEQVLPRVKADLGWGWEDICFRHGPLLSPEIFREVAVPQYRRISDTLLKYGCDLYLVDCDGMIDHLVPHWLEGGVNVMFPVEIGAWGADPQALRRRYGKELRLYGGVNKLEIAKGKRAIDAEIQRRLPLMKEGGYVPLPDHLLIPGIALADYRYYLERIRSLRF